MIPGLAKYRAQAAVASHPSSCVVAGPVDYLRDLSLLLTILPESVWPLEIDEVQSQWH